MRKLSPAVGGVLLLTGVNLFSQTLAFAYRIWLSRLIGPETLGLYALVMPVYSIVMSLCVSGMTVTVSRMTAALSALENSLAIRQTVRKARLGYLGVLAVLSVLVVPLSDALSVHFLGDARTRLGLLLLLPLIALTGWENVHKNYFYGRKNVIPPAVSEIIEQSVRTAAILGLLLYTGSVNPEAQVGLIVCGMIASEVVSALLLTLWYRFDRRRMPPRGRPLPDVWPQMLKIALPVAASGLLNSLIGSLNSVIIPGRLITSGMDPSEALSAFGVAFGMTMPLLSLPLAVTTAICLVMMPRLSESAALGDLPAIRRKVRDAFGVSLCVIALFTSLLIPFGTPIAQTLFRNKSAGAYMAPLAVATVFVCLEQVFGNFLNALGGQKKAAVNYITAGLVQLALTWWAVAQPSLRLYGYVVAYLAGNVLGAGLCLCDLGKILRGRNAPDLRAVSLEFD